MKTCLKQDLQRVLNKDWQFLLPHHSLPTGMQLSPQGEGTRSYLAFLFLENCCLESVFAISPAQRIYPHTFSLLGIFLVINQGH